MTITATTPVGKIATAHPLATRVFARHNIDFCCGGGEPLEKACAAKDAPLDVVMTELEAEIADAPASQINWAEEPLPSLIDHILVTYHKPLLEEMPRIEAMAQKVHGVHGDKDPARFAGIANTFSSLRADLMDHMMKEEEILFPMIREGQGSQGMGPVMVMQEEHVVAGQMLAKLRELTNDYRVPEEACNTWRALWVGLADLERSLHEHIHLENNILFPRALAS